MSDYTLEEVIDFIEDEINTAYEAAYYEGGCEDDTADECGSSCNETVDNVIDAYENGVITYEEAGDYLTLMTEARRLDKELLRKGEIATKIKEIMDDDSLPPAFKTSLLDKYDDDLKLRYKDRILLDRADLRKIAHDYKRYGQKYREFDSTGSGEKIDKKAIAKKLKELKDIKTKKVNTKVNPRDRSLGDELY